MSPEEKVIRSIESLLHRLKAINDQLVAKYPDGDLRRAIVGLSGNVLHSYLLHFAMAEYTITHKAWWNEAFQKEEPTASDMQALRNLESMTKHATFVFVFSRIEWCFRKLLTFLFPGACGNGSAAFKSVYDYLLNNLGLNKFVPLYDICRNVRNAVHSNATFISRNAANETIGWKGTNYVFEHMKPIDFMTYEIQFSLFSELIDSLEALLAVPAVRDPAHIEDKIH